MSVDSTIFRWHYAALRRPSRVPLMVAVAIMLSTSVLTFAIGYPLAAMAVIALAFTCVTGFKVPTPRIRLSGSGVEVFPRPPLMNSHYVFPTLAFAAAVLFTTQCWVSSPEVDIRLPIIAGLAWLATLITAGSAARQRGNLLVDAESIAVGDHPAVLLSVAEVTVLSAKNSAIPHIELVDSSGKNKKRLIFPEKYYGLDANSVYSTVRHLAETDAEVRNAYSPELIREMLLYKPDRDVALGDSIEVRVVAQPTATAS